jgi:hypothetical protein
MTVNQEAEKLVYGPREEAYSHPIVDFTTTGRMWSALIESHTGQAVEIDAEMVAVLMAALKLSRLSRNPGHRDSIVDVCGYMATYERVIEKREEEKPGWAAPFPKVEEHIHNTYAGEFGTIILPEEGHTHALPDDDETFGLGNAGALT